MIQNYYHLKSLISNGFEVKLTSPLCISTTIRYAMLKPKPVSTPTSLVVKKGSNKNADTNLIV
jgi:hypothetical protein